MKIIKKLFFILLLLLAAKSVYASAQNVLPSFEPGEDFVPGQLLALMVDGPCYYLTPTTAKWQRVEKGMTFTNDYSIRTGEHGYMVLSWSENNLIFIKPRSGLRIKQTQDMGNRLELDMHYAEIMLVVREAGGLIRVAGRHINANMTHGEAVYSSDSKGEVFKALSGNAAYSIDEGEIHSLFEQTYVETDTSGKIFPVRKFDQRVDYESFKRFNSWFKRFEDFHDRNSDDVAFKLNSIRINGVYLNDMRQEEGMYVIDTPDGKIPKTILFETDINPSPKGRYRIEMNLGHELVYVFREGSGGKYEVNFEIPSIPEFITTVQWVDSFDRRITAFRAGFTVRNKRAARSSAFQFCKDFSRAVTRHDFVWFRNNVSERYRDSLGYTSYDFMSSMEKAFKKYRNMRLDFHPFRYEFKKGRLQIHLSYRLFALTGNWKSRYEKHGTDVLSLITEGGRYKLISKTGGLYFSQLRITADLRRAVLRGRIVDEITGFPLEGVEVQIQDTPYRTYTDAMGEYIIHNVPAGNYSVKFSKNGYGVISTSSVSLTAAGGKIP